MTSDSKIVFDPSSHHARFHPTKQKKSRTAGKSTEKIPKTKKVCEECGSHVNNLKQHMEAVHCTTKLLCPHCSNPFKNQDNLKKHIEWVHVKDPCPECGEMIGRKKMTRHMQSKHTSIYDRRFKCDICGKGFRENSKLSEHKNVHTGAKPFKCKYCNACFASRGTQAMHQRSHLGHRRSK